MRPVSWLRKSARPADISEQLIEDGAVVNRNQVEPKKGIETAQVIDLNGGQGRNRTADASLFRTGIGSILNNLTGLGGLRKYLQSCDSRGYLGWNSWA